MANINQIKLPDNSVYDIQDSVSGYTTNLGTVTSVDIVGGTGLSASGGPITSSGSVTVNHSNSVTAQSTQAVYPITIDSEGHVSSYGAAAEFPTFAALTDFFYPIGSYYETSDTSFDPNDEWNGTWELEIAGQVHVSAGTDYAVAGALTNATDGGSSTVTLTKNQSALPAHGHGFTQPSVTGGAGTNNITGGSHSHNQQGWNGVTSNSGTVKEVRARNKITSDASDASTNVASTHTHSLPAHTHTVSGGAVSNNDGWNASEAHNNMQPYIIVNRWHRIA